MTNEKWHPLCLDKCQQQEKQVNLTRGGAKMKIYKTHRRSRLPLLFGMVLFALAMSMTSSDVYGFSNTPKNNKNDKHDNRNNKNDKDKKNDKDRDNDRDRDRDNDRDRDRDRDDRDHGGGGKDHDNPPQVPEPATMILLGSGLAAAYAMKRKNV